MIFFITIITYIFFSLAHANEQMAKISIKSCGGKKVWYVKGADGKRYFCDPSIDNSCPSLEDCKKHALKSKINPIQNLLSTKSIQSYNYSNEINILRSRRKVMREANLERVVAMARYQGSVERLDRSISSLVLSASVNKKNFPNSTEGRRNYASSLYHNTFLALKDYEGLKISMIYEKEYVYSKIQGNKDLLDMYDEYYASANKELEKIGETLRKRLEDSRKSEEEWNKLLIEKSVEFLDYQFLNKDLEDALRNMKRSPKLTFFADDFLFKENGVKKIRDLIKQADLSLHLLENRSELLKKKCNILTDERAKNKCFKTRKLTAQILVLQKKKVAELKEKYTDCYLPLTYSEEVSNELIDKCIPPTKKQFLSSNKVNGNMFFSILSPIEGGDAGLSPGEAARQDARAACGVACESRFNGDDQDSGGDSGADRNEERNVKGTDVKWAVYRDKETGNPVGEFQARGKMHDIIKNERAAFLREYDRLRKEIGAERALKRIRVDRDFSDRLDNLSRNVDDVQRRTGDVALLTLKREIDATKKEKDFWNKEIAKDTQDLVLNNDLVLKSISNISGKVESPKDINPTESDLAAAAVDVSMSLSAGIFWDTPTVVWGMITGQNLVGQSVSKFDLMMYSLGFLPLIDGAIAKQFGKAIKSLLKMSKGTVSKVKSLFDVAPKLTIEILAGWDKPGKVIEGILISAKRLGKTTKKGISKFASDIRLIASNNFGAAGSGVNDLVRAAGKSTKSTSNIGEFFSDGFGKVVKTKASPTSAIIQGQKVFKITKKIPGFKHLKKGDKFYLDGAHKNHLEVFDSRGRAKWVLNLDGTINIDKTAKAIEDGRRISN